VDELNTLDRRIRIGLGAQRLWLMERRDVLAEYPVSTALNGPGEMLGSGCTPRGLHRQKIKIGQDCPLNAVFVARRFTGEMYNPQLAAREAHRDWILTRVLWLTGLEPGRNRGGRCDTLRRLIYIHGTPDSEPVGEPHSHGCVRMRNADIVELFDAVPAGALVDIRE
jgi:hypothetical protein